MSLRTVTIIEIDPLPDLVTNTSNNPGGTVRCDTVRANGADVDGVGYTPAKPGAIGNVHHDIDAAHHGWIGGNGDRPPTSSRRPQVTDIHHRAPVASGTT